AGDLHGRELGAEREIRRALSDVLTASARILVDGGSSLDAVEDAVRRLEDSPLFNAGKGAVLNARGEHELDASIMDGGTCAAGAVAGLRHIKNPVALARRVMEASPHVFLQGQGAEEFARGAGFELVDPSYFRTEASLEALERVRAARRAAASAERTERRQAEPETVGAVALDIHGHLAAATSTGGITNKLPGRVSDSAVIGAGTYASDESCAVSCTGQGEYFIRATAARDVAALIEQGGKSLAEAAEAVLSGRVAKLGGRGGLIAVDKRGCIAWPFNTDTMYRGCVSSAAGPAVAIYRGEP
ncbi:MAG TPA: isoaspartyl peptidase/L-asparaginase, partial [Gammaproteobacteria bacterium]|nr:isoaspartyl peptidase/L-asparaginase [Gammaproteobacteria bacterium]